jgi:hypothetical protein
MAFNSHAANIQIIRRIIAVFKKIIRRKLHRSAINWTGRSINPHFAGIC